MMKLFLKSFLNIFLWILLLANLYMAFDMMFIVQGGANVINGVDYTNRYFGISSFISILQGDNPFGNLGVEYVSKYLREVNSTAQWLWNQPTPNFEEVTNIGEFASEVFDLLVNVVSKIGSVFVYAWLFMVNLVYILLNLLTLVYGIFGFFSGHYSKELPHTYDNLVMVITPLITSMV